MAIKKNTTTEERILEIAERLFLEKGFAMTSTTDIAKVAGCNQALVHYYYRTKERLFEAIFEKKATLFFSTFLEIEQDNLTFEEKLIRKISSHFDILRDNPRLPFLMINEFTTNPKRIRYLKEKLSKLPLIILNNMEKELKSEIKKKTLRPITLIDLIFTIISLNVTLFLAKPIIMEVASMTEKDFTKFLEYRKKEHIRIILTSLKL